MVLFASIGSFIEGIGANHAAMGLDDFFTAKSVMDLGSYLYLICHIAVPALLLLYARTVMDIYATKTADMVLLYMPIIVAYTCLLINPLNNGVFIHDNGEYHRGNLMVVFYVAAAWYIIQAVYTVFKYRNNILRSVFISFMVFTVLSVMGVFIQLVEHSMKIENLMNALSVLIFYMTIERPGDYIDSATGLQNDYSFYVNSSIRIKRSREARFIAISIDNMEFVDKSIGHEEAYELLRQIALYLDSVSKDTIAYRLQRDVFVLAVREKARLNHITLMEEIRKRFSAPFVSGRYSVVFFECVMYVNWPGDVKNTEELKRLLTMFSDKDRHKMRHVLPASTIDLDMDRRKREIDLLLRTVIADERVSFKYQPVKSVSTGKFDSVDMKPMIESASMGVIAPSEYYPVAEENGTAVAIVKYIVDVGFTYMSENNLLGDKLKGMTIPMPSAFLMMRNASEWIIKKAEEKGIDPSFITFVVTERTLMNYSHALQRNMTALYEAGFSFMLNDYGNGYTDVEMMMKMHLKGVGINRDLMSSAPLSRKADILVRSAIDMMKKQSISVKAVGIDSEELEEYAVKAGVDKLQGFALARFLTGAELLGFLSGQRRENK